MKRISPLLALLLFIVPGSMFAQTPAVIDGLQVIAERQYAATSDGTIDTSSEGVYLASARVYLFDSEADVQPVWDTLVDVDVIKQDLGESADTEIAREDLKDIGDQAVSLTVDVDLEDNTTSLFRTVIARRGAMIVTVNTIAGSADAAMVADTMATAMIARDPGSAPSVYDGYGESSGGVWDVFLPKDAKQLSGLIAYMDKETRPSAT